MLRKDKFVVGEYYHVYNRGVDKQVIFKEISDYQRFINLLYIANSTKSFKFEDLSKKRNYNEIFKIEKGESLVSIGAWCLMNNHFHILIREESEGGVSKFMKKLCTGYSMYFNKKYQRPGALFQGRFQAKHISDDLYFQKLFSYIHCNPLEILDNKSWLKIENKEISPEPKNFTKELSKYLYSSFLDYYIKNDKQRDEIVVINKKDFPFIYR